MNTQDLAIVTAALILLTDGQALLSCRKNWTRWANARDFQNVTVRASASAARCWCAAGAVQRAQRDWDGLPPPERLVAERAEGVALDALNRQAGIRLDGKASAARAIQDLNDAPGVDAAYEGVMECYRGAIADLRSRLPQAGEEQYVQPATDSSAASERTECRHNA